MEAHDYLTEQPFSSRIGDLLAGCHELKGSHTDRVRLLAELQILNNTKDLFGWWEHTSDWDWRVSVTLNTGAVVGSNDTSMCDTFRIETPVLDETLDFHSLPEEARKLPKTLILEIIPDEGKAWNLYVPINDIQSILIAEA